jgi:hypothetical protein
MDRERHGQDARPVAVVGERQPGDALLVQQRASPAGQLIYRCRGNGRSVERSKE